MDENQTEIVATFRELGCSVLHLHAVGKGCPDLLVGIGGENYLVEVKDGSKPRSQQRLTPLEAKFALEWRGRPVRVVTTPGEAIELIEAARRV